MRRLFASRGLITAVVLTAAALAGGLAPASAATGPDGAPILSASSGDRAHSCEVLTPVSGAYEAVICVDINTASSVTGYSATGVVEAFCKIGTTTQTVPCSYIDVDGIFANAESGSNPPEQTWSCAGLCPSGRLLTTIGTFNYVGGHDCTSSFGHNVWTVAVGGPTYIGLPDGTTLSVGINGSNDDGNYSTGHYWICP